VTKSSIASGGGVIGRPPLAPPFRRVRCAPGREQSTKGGFGTKNVEPQSTDRKRASSSVARRATRLSKLTGLKSESLAMMSHEDATPLPLDHSASPASAGGASSARSRTSENKTAGMVPSFRRGICFGGADQRPGSIFSAHRVGENGSLRSKTISVSAEGCWVRFPRFSVPQVAKTRNLLFRETQGWDGPDLGGVLRTGRRKLFRFCSTSPTMPSKFTGTPARVTIGQGGPTRTATTWQFEVDRHRPRPSHSRRRQARQIFFRGGFRRADGSARAPL